MFFIISQPRCGTAWLANALTWTDSFCHHEGIYGMESMDDYDQMLNATPADHVGDSDTVLALVLPWLYERYPEAKYVFVDRSHDDVESSIVKAGFSTFNLAEIRRSIAWGRKNMDCLEVQFDDVFNNTQRIWDYIGLEDYPEERFKMLRHMKVDDSASWLDSKPVQYSNLMRSAA